MDVAFSIAAFLASAASLAVVLLRKPAPIPLVQPVSGGEAEALAFARKEIEALNAKLSEALEAARLADRKAGADVLAAYADQAVAAAEQFGGTGPEKLRKALDALRALDAGDNGRRDWTDAQHRIAIEAAIARAK